MQPNDIDVGSHFFAKVSGDTSVEVEVVADTGEPGRRYQLKRADNGVVLTRLRAAAALHEEPGPWEAPAPSIRPPAVNVAKGYKSQTAMSAVRPKRPSMRPRAS